MPRPLVVELTDEERIHLQRIRDTDPHPYVRERAAALLKMADGHSAREVASHGLLKARYHETPVGWWRRFRAEGTQGLHIHPGRGRKPSAPP
jgi:transposase